MKILYIADLNQPPNHLIIETLKNKYTVLIADNNKEKLSSRNHLESIVKSLLGKDFIIVGEGLGGYWAIQLASKYELFSLTINPCLDPRNQYGLNLDKLSTSHIWQRSFMLVKDIENQYYEQIQKASDDYCKVIYYKDTTDKFGQLIHACMEDLKFYYRTRAYGIQNSCAHNDHGYLGTGKAFQVISKVLHEVNPINIGYEISNQYGAYDFPAKQIAELYLLSAEPLRYLLERNLKFYFNATLNPETLDKIVTKIENKLPESVKKQCLSFEKTGPDSSFLLTKKEANELRKLNDKLYEFEKNIFPQVIKLDSEYQNQLLNSQNPLSSYSLEIVSHIYLQEKDRNYDEDGDNYISVIYELGTGCSKISNWLTHKLERDHNSLPPGHSLNKFKHSWIFHHLYAVSKISFVDLLRIGLIWVDVRVTAKERGIRNWEDIAKTRTAGKGVETLKKYSLSQTKPSPNVHNITFYSADFSNLLTRHAWLYNL